MAITTAPTQAMKDAIAAEFKTQFPTDWEPPEDPGDLNDAVAEKFGEIIAIAVEKALTEVKTNAVALDGTQGGGDSLDID